MSSCTIFFMKYTFALCIVFCRILLTGNTVLSFVGHKHHFWTATTLTYITTFDGIDDDQNVKDTSVERNSQYIIYFKVK